MPCRPAKFTTLFGAAGGKRPANLELVAKGYTNPQIGQMLHLAEETVKHYMTNILQKLQVNNRVQAALIAERRGLLKEDGE